MLLKPSKGKNICCCGVKGLSILGCRVSYGIRKSFSCLRRLDFPPFCVDNWRLPQLKICWRGIQLWLHNPSLIPAFVFRKAFSLHQARAFRAFWEFWLLCLISSYAGVTCMVLIKDSLQLWQPLVFFLPSITRHTLMKIVQLLLGVWQGSG